MASSRLPSVFQCSIEVLSTPFSNLHKELIASSEQSGGETTLILTVFAMNDLGPGMILNFQRQLRSPIPMDDFVPMGTLHRLQFDYNRRYASRLTNQSYRSLRQTTETIAH